MLQRAARQHARTLDKGCSYCTAGNTQAKSSIRQGKQVARPHLRQQQATKPIDWSLPSTSRIPYSPPPPPASSRSFASSASASSSLRPTHTSSPHDPQADTSRLEEELEHFLALESPKDRLAARDSVCRLLSSLIPASPQSSSHHPAALDSLSRTKFDDWWYRIAALEPAVSAALLKRLRDLAAHLRARGGNEKAEEGQEWQLSHEQKRQVLLARTAQDEFEARLRRRTAATGRGKVMRRRWAYLDECADELEESARRRRTMMGREVADEGEGEVEAQREEDVKALERYSLRLVERASACRPSSSPDRSSSSSSTSTKEAVDLALRSAHFLHLALSLSPSLPPPSHHHDVEPEISPTYSAPLPLLFAHESIAALELLRCMLQKGWVPTPGAVREVIREWYRDPPGFGRGDAAAAREGGSDEKTAGKSEQTQRREEAEAEEEAVYARARQILDEACSPSSLSLSSVVKPEVQQERSSCGGGGGDQLELLLQERLERVERAEALLHEPTLYMIRWLGLLRRQRRRGDDEDPRAISIEEKQAALECALSLWEVSQIQGRDEFAVAALQTSKSRVARLLEALVLEACELEREAAAAAVDDQGDQSGGKRQVSAALEKALDLAGRYMLPHLLVHHSGRLLRAATVSAHAPHLAFALFDVLTDPSPSRHPSTISNLRGRRKYRPPFTWTLDLLPTFVTLFLSACSPAAAAAKDDSLPLRLYLSWTASGLSFPDGLWNELWRALGRRGSVDELKRVVQDWEETGRGQIAGRISAMVLAAACGPRVPSLRPAPVPTSARTVHGPLRLLAYFRSRYLGEGASVPSLSVLASSPYLVVPLSGYTAVLRALARSHTDQRPAQRVVWRYLLRDGHSPDLAAYNALLAAQVWRPDPHYTVKDLDDAGVVYNQLIEAGRHARDPDQQRQLQPDRETFSLLVHGFLRIAAGSNRIGRQKRDITLEAAHRTFTAAAERGIGIRGHQAARLVRALAGAERFEDAKEVQEKWWRTLVALENEWDMWRRSYGRREKRGESMWEDEEVKNEMREMRMAREDAERVEARSKVAQRGARPSAAEDRDVEVGMDGEQEEEKGDAGAETPEAFATLPLGTAGNAAGG
ncbi:hypothetical protein JCM10908_005176 [Rhodotorula pacifica]|uniref:uncharacterized protein n=1 Tax=Rhodotorula pacifica TaxID=1495444 RepID=UPI0031719ED5